MGRNSSDRVQGNVFPTEDVDEIGIIRVRKVGWMPRRIYKIELNKRVIMSIHLKLELNYNLIIKQHKTLV